MKPKLKDDPTPGKNKSIWENMKSHWDEAPEWPSLWADIQSLTKTQFPIVTKDGQHRNIYGGHAASCWGCAAFQIGWNAGHRLVRFAKHRGWSPGNLRVLFDAKNEIAKMGDKHA